jgi:hypothetical protein
MNASIKYGVALVAALAMFGTAAQAALITNSPTIVSGGITFSDFRITLTGQGDRAPTDPNAVAVVGLASGNGIQITSGFNAAYIDQLSAGDAYISYKATGTGAIGSIGLSFDASFLGFAIASVTETVYRNADFTGEIGQGVVSCGFVTGCTADTRETSIALSGMYDTLYVVKDINLTAFRTGGFTQTSVITQTYGPTAVPEPMSIALFGTGLVGLGLVRRARKAAKSV